MKTIILNRRKLDVTEGDMRVLFTLLCSNFAAKKSEFNEGSGNYIKSILPRDRNHWAELGISEVYSPRTAREKLFFKKNPRCQSGIFGNPRRIKAILKALDAEVEREHKEELEFIRHETLTIPSDAEMEREIVNLESDF